FTCPDCQSVLRTGAAIAPGKKIKCPKCGSIFVMPEGDETPAPSAAISERRRAAPPADDQGGNGNGSATPARQRRAVVTDDEDEDEDEDLDEPRPKKKKKKKKKGGANTGLLIGLGVGALVLLLLVGGVTAFVWPGFLVAKGPAKSQGTEDPLAYL